MREFLVKLFKIALAILVMATIGQGILSLWINGKTTNGHDNFFSVRNQKNDIIFLGSSRCTNQFIPAVFKDSLGINSVNLGVNGHSDLPVFIMRLMYYLKYNPPPRYAVLSFDPMCQCGPLDFKKNIDFTNKHYFARYAFFAQKDNSMIVNYFHFNFAEQYVPLYAVLKYKMLFDCITMKGGKRWLRNGYLKNDGIWDSTAHHNGNGDNIFERNDDVPRFNKNYDSLKNDLQYLNNYCLENKIKLICIQTPVYKIEYNKLFLLPGKMCNELGITFIDFGNEEAITNDLTNFEDPIHLNSKGARVFCNYLCSNKQFLEAIKN